ncbi:hypothetical protein HZB08_02055 [Candidatus Saganbacteria bacterium]|uniref:Uncharacterized protein n=1 Tax=Candidatus Saganbacteria bacterium TaxID=2575572 RepID=A0A9D6YV87_UNCSA|nr:hypothetical protein [Candidatus Saganbacteria bacterium]
MTPTLSQVLVSGGRHASLSMTHFAAVLVVVCAAAFSAVKGYEIYRRRRRMPAVMEEVPLLLKTENNEKIERFSFMIDELETQLKAHSHQIEDLKQSNDFLYKNNLALTRESERLKLEKEDLVLKASAPLVRAESPSPEPKTIKKEVSRKPKRVSRKGR